MSSNKLSEILSNLSALANSPWIMGLEECQKHALKRTVLLQAFDGLSAPQVGSLNEGVAVVDIAGVFMPSAEHPDDIDTGLLGELFGRLAADESVSAVVYNIDSPGGAAAGMSELIEASTKLAAAKPVFAFTNSCMCSAAYWLAATASSGIYAGVDADVGSIGTRIFTFDMSKAFAEAGIEAVAIDTGEFKSMGAFGTELTAQHREYLQQRVDKVQESFSATVQSGRKLTNAQLKAVSDGKVFRVDEAVSLGLIDGVSKKAEVLKAAGLAAALTTNPGTIRSKTMSQTTEMPNATTLSELKKVMPESTAEFREAQLEAGATLAEALSAHNRVLKEENTKLVTEREEAARLREDEDAKEKARSDKEAKEKATATTGKKGHKLTAETVSGVGEGDPVSYAALAKSYQKAHNCRWSEACLAIKKQHPEARAFFGAPAKEDE